MTLQLSSLSPLVCSFIEFLRQSDYIKWNEYHVIEIKSFLPWHSTKRFFIKVLLLYFLLEGTIENRKGVNVVQSKFL